MKDRGHVAITVLMLSVIMGVGNIKDGNIVQNMQQAKSDSVDASEALLTTAISIAAVAALVESGWTLGALGRSR